jgi:methylmalonyl-CoA mutase
MDAKTPLSDGFPQASREIWLALAEKTLKGAGLETLDRTTPDGLKVRAFYDAVAAGPPTGPRPLRGGPGWDLRASIAESDPIAAEARILEALAGGATSVVISVGSPDRPGVRIEGAEAFARLTRGVMTDIAPVALDAGALGRAAALWLDAAAKASPAAPLAFHLDPASAFASRGAWVGSIAKEMAQSAALGRRLAEAYPRASLFLASGRVAHEAGGSAAAEIAFAAAGALAYAKALVGAGLSMSEAWGRIVLGLAVEGEPITAIAKLRAARLVWARLAGACGAALPARLECRPSERMLTRAEPWTNLVRLTCAGFAAAVGGADAVVLASPGEGVAAHLALNVQIILMEEAHLGQVADPAGGAWAIEAHTGDLARAAWDLFARIETEGGLIAALERGTIAAEVARGRDVIAAELARGARRIVGVTDFAPSQAPPTPAAGVGGRALDPPAPGDRCPPLTPIRLEDLVG